MALRSSRTTFIQDDHHYDDSLLPQHGPKPPSIYRLFCFNTGDNANQQIVTEEANHEHGELRVRSGLEREHQHHDGQQ
jgi:hypothetical protein